MGLLWIVRAFISEWTYTSLIINIASRAYKWESK